MHRRVLFVLFGLSLLSASVFAEQLAPSVGDIDFPNCLSIAGTKTFAEGDIKQSLVDDWQVFLASHPDADRGQFVELLRRKVTDGYKCAGFPNIEVNLEYSEFDGRIVVTVKEGQRFNAGTVTVSGNASIATEELVQVVRNCTNARYTAMWVPNAPADFTEDAMSRSARAVKDAYGKLGFLYPELEVKPVLYPEKNTADLAVEVKSEGPLCKLGDIQVSGLERNKPEDVLALLNVTPGEVLTTDLLKTIEKRLVDSACFLDVKVNLADKDKSEVTKSVLVDLKEYSLAPLLTEQPKPSFKLFQLLAEWLRTFNERAKEDIVMKGVLAPVDFNITISPDKGMAVTIKTSEKQWAVDADVILMPNSVLLVDNLHKIKWSAPCNAQFTVSFKIRVNPKATDGQFFEFQFSALAGSKHNPEDSSFVLDVDTVPVGFVSLAAKTEDTGPDVNGVHAVKGFGGTFTAWIDEATGRPIEIIGFEPEHGGADLCALTVKGAFDKRVGEIANASNAFANKQTNASLGFVSFAGIVFDMLSFDGVIPDEQKNVLKIIRDMVRHLLESIGPEADAAIAELVKCREHLFFIPAPQMPTPGGLPFVSSFVQFLMDQANQCSAKSWERVVFRQAVHLLLGNVKYWGGDVRRLYASEDIGPVGYLLLAEISGDKYPAPRVYFAAKGLSDLSVQGFHKDYDIIVDSTIGLQMLTKIADDMRKLDDKSLEELCLLVAAKSGGALANSAVQLLPKDKELTKADICQWLDGWWDSGLRQLVEDTLRAAVTPKPQ